MNISNLFFNKFCIILFGFVSFIVFQICTKVGLTIDLEEFPENPQCKYHETQHIGSEDITKIAENIVVSMSNDNILMWESEKGLESTPPGYIWIYYLDTKQSKILEIQNRPQNFVFQPHGLYYDEDNSQLSAINHSYQGDGDQIEVFDLNKEDLEDIKITYVRSYMLPVEINGITNDLIKINKYEYIVTQWITYPDYLDNSSRNNMYGKIRKLGQVFNTSMNRKTTYVHLCSSKNTQIDIKKQKHQLECVKIEGADGIVNNGITWDKKNTVLVADSADNVINVYELNQDQQDRSQILKKRRQIKTTRHPDNIEYDQYLNQYTTGGMGKLHQYLSYLENQIKVHPYFTEKVENFWVFFDVIKPVDVSNYEYKVENVLLKSDVYRGCSSGVQYKDEIIIGSFTDKSIATCKINGINPNQDKYIPPTMGQVIKQMIKKMIS